MAITRESTGLRNEYLKSSGSSKADALANGHIKLYSGTIPASADDAIDGTELVEITESGLPFAPGTATNGINLDVAALGIVAKATSEDWQGTNGATGTVAYGVFYGNSVADSVITASTTAKRIVFDVNTSGAAVTVSSTSLVNTEITALTTFTNTAPE